VGPPEPPKLKKGEVLKDKTLGHCYQEKQESHRAEAELGTKYHCPESRHSGVLLAL
jgi:hypothetical protein